MQVLRFAQNDNWKSESESKSKKAKRQELMQGLSTALATPSGKDARWGPGSLRSR